MAAFAILSVGSIPAAHASSPKGQRHVQWAPLSFTELAEKYSPAVVNIRSEKNGKRHTEMAPHFKGGPFDKDDPFRDFFEKFFGGRPNQGFKQRSLGSGFIIDQSGFIVTNNTRGGGCGQNQGDPERQSGIRCGNQGAGSQHGFGPHQNQIRRLNCPTIQFGDSDHVKVGEWVMAIGNPFGLEHTVTVRHHQRQRPGDRFGAL